MPEIVEVLVDGARVGLAQVEVKPGERQFTRVGGMRIPGRKVPDQLLLHLDEGAGVAFMALTGENANATVTLRFSTGERRFEWSRIDGNCAVGFLR